MENKTPQQLRDELERAHRKAKVVLIISLVLIVAFTVVASVCISQKSGNNQPQLHTIFGNLIN